MEFSRFGMIGLLVVALLSSGCQEEKRDSKAPAPSHHATPAGPVAVDPKSEFSAIQSVRVAKADEEPSGFTTPVPLSRESQEMTLVSIPITEAPTIDGRAEEAFWATAPSITTLDYSSQRPITLKSAYTQDMAFFLVTFPVEKPSETHKTWFWDTKEEVYREGPDREDVFVFKWSLSGNNVSLAVRDGELHRADIWFWKAHRSNPAGYADDKWQGISLEEGPESRLIPSPKHGKVYFRRSGDTGEPAFDEKFYFDYQGPQLEKYVYQQPTGSRGDIRAKGLWHDGQWTIELARKLNTGHDDDVVLTPGQVVLFAVSCYAIAYDTPHQAWSQPLYRTGDAFDRLFFSMAPR